jgi:hypothetical protein
VTPRDFIHRLISHSVIESVLEQLVTWAAAALEMSSNQPVLPHVIIALNASDLDIDELQWDPDVATASVLESLSRTVFKNAIFKKYAQFWRERQRQIETVQQLIESYYTTIRVRVLAIMALYCADVLRLSVFQQRSAQLWSKPKSEVCTLTSPLPARWQEIGRPDSVCYSTPRNSNPICSVHLITLPPLLIALSTSYKPHSPTAQFRWILVVTY